MSGRTLCSLKYQNSLQLYRAPYMPALVAALKAGVPASDRRWDPAARAYLSLLSMQTRSCV